MRLDLQYIWLATSLFSFSENRRVLEKKHYDFNLGSTETVNCSKEKIDFGNVSWYNNSTGFKIKSGGRIRLSDSYLEFKSIQLSDAGTYECRRVSSTRFYSIAVNGEFALCPCCSSSQHYFRYPSPQLQCIVLWY